jgi:hypothetical protein
LASGSRERFSSEEKQFGWPVRVIRRKVPTKS